MAVQTRSIEKIVFKAIEDSENSNKEIHELLGMTPRQFSDRARRDQAFREKTDEVNSVLSLVKSTHGSIENRINQERNQVVQAEQEVERLRTSFVQATRNLKTAKERLRLTIEDGNRIPPDVIMSAAKQLGAIRDLPSVKRAWAESSNPARLIIEPYPVVIAHEYQHFLLGEDLSFSIDFAHMTVKWEVYGIHNPAIHPHISTSGVICWGGAESLIQQAKNNRDFAGMTKVILDWITLYNNESPYNHISAFPTTDLPTGYQVPA